LVDSAPTHVNNFVFLAEQGWYQDSDFFFVQENFAALAGDPTNTGVGYPGYYCIGEAGPFEGAGLVGMLPNGQIFFTLGADATELSGQFPLVGEVIEGQDVLDAIAATATETGEIEDPAVLEGVTVTQQ
ncbi:MAG: peptidylprolyl isomerase, partial [Anaerolineae bacterium]